MAWNCQNSFKGGKILRHDPSQFATKGNRCRHTQHVLHDDIMRSNQRRKSSHFHFFFIGFSILGTITLFWSSYRLLSRDDSQRLLLDTASGLQRAIFYNIYVPNESKLRHSMNIVKEQLSMKADSPFISSAPVYYTVIGFNATNQVQQECGSKCHILQYQEQGNEGLTLQSLYEYCQEHPDALVTYLHNKGSHHATPTNRLFRHFLTKGAYSNECQSIGVNDAQSCNVCGARFSPFPHMHMAGNMWTAQCSYVRKLIEPKEFTAKMEELMEAVMQAPDSRIPRPTFQQYQDEYFVGRSRFAMEHWIGSHPTVQPCDVYEGSYLCGYRDIPTVTDEWTPSLQQAPRFPISIFEKRAAYGNWFCGQARLLEFRYLYNQRPPVNSFVWKFFSSAFKACQTPLSQGESVELLFLS